MVAERLQSTVTFGASRLSTFTRAPHASLPPARGGNFSLVTTAFHPRAPLSLAYTNFSFTASHSRSLPIVSPIFQHLPPRTKRRRKIFPFFSPPRDWAKKFITKMKIKNARKEEENIFLGRSSCFRFQFAFRRWMECRGPSRLISRHDGSSALYLHGSLIRLRASKFFFLRFSSLFSLRPFQ